MPGSKLKAAIHILQNFTFSTLLSNTPPSSLVPFQKCCQEDQLYFVDERKCVSYDFNASPPSPDPRPDPSKFQIQYGFPRSYPNYWYIETESWIRNVSDNGSLDLHLLNKENTYNFERGEYCFDVAVDISFNPVLITNNQLIPVLPVEISYLIPYCISMVLLVVTLSLHLAMPKLHAKLKDKCFMCYLVSLLFWMIIYADTWEMNGISFLKKFVSIDVSLSLEWYSFMVTFSWLNVMCVHLWRCVTSVNSIPPRNIYAYALYALGLPLICRILFYTDRSLSKLRNFADRSQQGGLFVNPVLRYTVVVCSIQQIINIGIFFHIGYIIWKQKRRWNRNDHIKNKHYCQEKSIFSQLLRLLIIVDVEWIYIFLLIYFGIVGKTNGLTQFCFWVKLSPGYFIFIVYVCCNKQVTSSLRKRFSNTRRTCEKDESVTSPNSSQIDGTMSLTLSTETV